MIHVVNQRPPGDNFTFELFVKFVNNSNVNSFGACYVWSAILNHHLRLYSEDREKLEKALEENTSDLIIFALKDHLTVGNVNPHSKDDPYIVSYLRNLIGRYPKKYFVIVTSVENLQSYIQYENVSIVEWGGDLTNYRDQHKKLLSVKNKNFDSPYTFLSLNRNFRDPRTIALSLLYGLGFDKHGLISCMFKDKVTELPPWDLIDLYPTLEDGLQKLKQSMLKINDDYEIWGEQVLNTARNFDQKLRQHYENTFVDIISETSFNESAYLITEKTLNSVYGCSFPILLSSVGAVQFLRDMGLDMFDDIVNHSYDKITHPTDRIYRAIIDNQELLTNNERTKELWKKCERRFLDNVLFARKGLYEFYDTRATQQFNEAIKEYKRWLI